MSHHESGRTFVGRGRWALLRRRGSGALLGLGAAIVPAVAAAQGVLENPGANSAMGGISLVSGWHCSAGQITIAFDGGTPIEAAYGTTRDDTIPSCGDANNGFGLLWNYGLLGAGAHETVAYADGVEFGRASFTVTTLGVPFLPGAVGSAEALQFPGLGESLSLVWNQGLQSFTPAARCGTSPGGIVCPPQVSAGAWAMTASPESPVELPVENAYSSASGYVSVGRSSPGRYEVTMPGVGRNSLLTGDLGGIAHVVARSVLPAVRRCDMTGFFGAATDAETIHVNCDDAAGNPADTRFFVHFSRPAAGTGRRAYLSTDATDSTSYVPNLLFNYNSTGRPNRIDVVSPGIYQATLPGLGRDGGAVALTTMNGSRTCQIRYWGASGADLQVSVGCFDLNGIPANSRWALTYVDEAPLAPGGGEAAYLWADDPTAASYTPSTQYQWHSRGQTNTITRSGTGRYEVALPLLAAPVGPGGAGDTVHPVVHVTAYDGGGAHACQVETLMADPARTALVGVGCTDAAGLAADSRFVLLYQQ